jgi:hypothetical protein
MVRLLAMVLSLQVIIAGEARAIDFHDSAPCTDSAMSTPENTGEHETAGQYHPGNCCFGSLLFGSPVTAPLLQVPVSVQGPPEWRNTLAAVWHSKAPERPPRS